MFLKGKLDVRRKFYEIVHSVGWLSSYYALLMVTGLFVGALVARTLGVEKYADLNYALFVITLFGTIATAGLGGVMIRELSQFPKQKNHIVSAGFFIQLIGSIVAYILLIIFCYSKVLQTAYENRAIILVVGIGIFANPFTIVNYYFQSIIKNDIFAIAGICSNLIYCGHRLILVMNKSLLVWYAFAYTLTTLFNCFFLFIKYLRLGGKLVVGRKVKYFVYKIMRDCWPVLFSNLLFIFQGQMDIFMVAEMCSKNELGQFSLAMRLYMMFLFVPSMLVQIISPYIQRAFKHDKADYYTKLKYAYKAMFLLTLLMIVFFWLLGNFVVVPLWSEQFKHGAFITSLMGFRFFFQGLSSVSSQHYVAVNMLRWTIVISIFVIILNFFLNLWLIPKYQALGAYYATMLTFAIVSMFDIIHPKTRSNWRCMCSSIIFFIDKQSIIDAKYFIGKYKNRSK